MSWHPFEIRSLRCLPDSNIYLAGSGKTGGKSPVEYGIRLNGREKAHPISDLAPDYIFVFFSLFLYFSDNTIYGWYLWNMVSVSARSSCSCFHPYCTTHGMLRRTSFSDPLLGGDFSTPLKIFPKKRSLQPASTQEPNNFIRATNILYIYSEELITILLG